MNRFIVFILINFIVFGNKAQNALIIPPALSGKTFNLNLQVGSRQFFTGHTTPTYGINGDLLGPTLILQKGDSVTINVKNTLPEKTTIHWHGFHVPAKFDGGPHQVINQGATWSPKFKILNEASTLWYHPHGNMTTERHVGKGMAGMVIVKDNIESTYNLPRTYGVDDIPMVVQTKAFDVLYQIQPATELDSVLMVNGTIHPFLQVPQQIVRLRLLNGSASRTFLFGMEDASFFYMIASDGGLLAKPIKLNRLSLSPGERAEVLIDFSAYSIGQNIRLKSFGSELKNNIIGAASVGNSLYSLPGYNLNRLNGKDFDIIRFDVIAPTSSPVTAIPAAFNPLSPFTESQATVKRQLDFTPDFASISGQAAIVDGPFLINNETFDMNKINQVVYLDDIEVWTLTNAAIVAHPFHIHDIEFYVLDINRKPPPPELEGKKDVILVQQGDTIRFITKFDDFSDETVPYMYHCHLLHHEDEGMMGTFIVKDKNNAVHELQKGENKNVIVYPNPSNGQFQLSVLTKDKIIAIEIVDPLGKLVWKKDGADIAGNSITVSLPESLQMGLYCIKIIENHSNAFYKLILNGNRN